jgi:di/tricarboxylate transporter
MTPQIALLLSIILGALLLFSIEIIPADVVALGVILVLTISGLLPADQVFAGFGSDAVVLILGLLILTAALLRTGVVEMAGEIILKKIGISHNRLFLATLLIPAILSAFISNTAATALFIPVVIGLARRTHLRASRMLMPLAFATILASSVTLVATSTNIVVSGLLSQYNMAPLGMFELAPVGIPILVVGLAYMYFIGMRLIPDRVTTEKAYDQISSDPYLTEIRLDETSTLIGKSLNQTRLGRDWDMTVLRVTRGDNQILAPTANLDLLAGDTLLVEANRDDIVRMIRSSGIELMSDVPLADAGLETGEYRLVEVILLLRSPLIGRTLSNAEFRERFGLQVLAINRHGETISRNISQTPLHIGDVLLIQGHRSSITALEEDKTFRILGEVEPKHINLKRAKIALGAFAGALLLATLN